MRDRDVYAVFVNPVVFTVKADCAAAEETEVVDLVCAEEDHKGNESDLCNKEQGTFDDPTFHHVAKAHDDMESLVAQSPLTNLEK